MDSDELAKACQRKLDELAKLVVEYRRVDYADMLCIISEMLQDIIVEVA